MSESTEVIPIPADSAVGDALPASAIRAQVNLIQHVMREVMVPDVHYGIIPGTPKPTLLKPGAEKLCLTFRLDPQYDSSERFVGEHLFVKSRCTLYHQTTGRRLGSGEGSCSSKESKYAYRQGKRLCPACGKETIIKGKDEYGGGWLCYKKKGGCGSKWPDGAREIEGQNTERVANEDVADQYNTVLKMANKRSLVAAVLNVTAASDLFTQDIEDLPEFERHGKSAPTGVSDGLDVSSGTSSTASGQAGLVTPPQQQQDGLLPPISRPAAFVWKITGKHKDESITTIDDSYLDWFVANGKREDHVEAAVLELDRRRGQGALA